MNTTPTNTTTTLLDPLPFPFYNEIAITLLLLSIYATEQFFSKMLKTSPLLGQLLAGIVLGPACFNLIPFASAFRFLGKLGVMLLVVEAGLATDMQRVVKYGTRSFFAALSGTVSPVLLAVAGGFLFFGADVRVGLAAGSAIAPTSLGFSAKLLGPEGLQTNMGAIIAISAVVDDVLSLCLLEIVRALGSAETMWDYLRPVVASLGSIVGGLCVVFLIKRWNFIARTIQCIQSCASQNAKLKSVDTNISQHTEESERNSVDDGHGTTVLGSAPTILLTTPHDRLYLLLLMFLSVGLGWACASVGSSDLLGCFLAGLAFSDSRETLSAFRTHFAKLTKVGTSLFFACTIGFGVPSLVNGSGLFSSAAVGRGAMLLFAALVGKAIPLGFFATPLGTISFFKFAIAMQGRGEFSFLIADTAKVEGVLDNAWHSGCIWAVFLASFVAPFGFRYVLMLEKKTLQQNKKLDDMIFEEEEEEGTGKGGATKTDSGTTRTMRSVQQAKDAATATIEMDQIVSI